MQRSFEQTLFYISSFLIFIFFYNHKKDGEQIIDASIIWGSVFFVTYFLILLTPIKTIPFLAEPIGGYQLVVSNFGSHNHLGDYLGLFIIFLIYQAITKKIKVFGIFIVLVLPFFLLSYSRSSYNALLLTGLYYGIVRRKNSIKGKKIPFVFGVMGIILLFFSVFTVRESRSIPILKSTNDIFSSYLNLGYKELLSKRPEYIMQSIKSFYANSFFGVGPGNYGYASSLHFSHPLWWSETSHNLFLDVLVENGLPAVICFALFIFFILKSGRGTNLVYPLLFIYLLLVFQTDYTYRIYSLFILFMILAGIIYKEEKEMDGSFVYGTTSLILHLALILVITSRIFLHADKPHLSVYAYPLSKQAYQSAIITEDRVGNNSGAFRLARMYEWVGSYDIRTLEFLGHFYEENHNKEKALKLFEKANQMEGFSSFVTVKKIYLLKKEVSQEKKAKEFLESAFAKLKQQDTMSNLPDEIKTQITDFCKENETDICAKTGW